MTCNNDTCQKICLKCRTHNESSYLELRILFERFTKGISQCEILKRVLVFNVQELPRVLQQFFVHVKQEISAARSAIEMTIITIKLYVHVKHALPSAMQSDLAVVVRSFQLQSTVLGALLFGR